MREMLFSWITNFKTICVLIIEICVKFVSACAQIDISILQVQKKSVLDEFYRNIAKSLLKIRINRFFTYFFKTRLWSNRPIPLRKEVPIVKKVNGSRKLGESKGVKILEIKCSLQLKSFSWVNQVTYYLVYRHYLSYLFKSHLFPFWTVCFATNFARRRDSRYFHFECSYVKITTQRMKLPKEVYITTIITIMRPPKPSYREST